MPSSKPRSNKVSSQHEALGYNTPIFQLKVTHMKTTIELSDVLFQSAKAHAQQHKTTLRALIEEGLEQVLHSQQAKKANAFKLKDASVRGKALQLSDPSVWQQLEQDHVLARALKPVAKRT